MYTLPFLRPPPRLPQGQRHHSKQCKRQQGCFVRVQMYTSPVYANGLHDNVPRVREWAPAKVDKLRLHYKKHTSGWQDDQWQSKDRPVCVQRVVQLGAVPLLAPRKACGGSRRWCPGRAGAADAPERGRAPSTTTITIVAAIADRVHRGELPNLLDWTRSSYRPNVLRKCVGGGGQR